jgi:hypothetical protein
MKVKKFEQFLKSRNINEDLDPIETRESQLEDDTLDLDGKEFDDVEVKDSEEFDSPDDFKKEFHEEEEEFGDDFTEDEDEFDEEEEPEEEGEYIGTTMLNKLAKALGTEVVNNQINYEGQKINFYSETESFHIGNKKFKTVEEVLDFLKPEESHDDMDNDDLGPKSELEVDETDLEPDFEEETSEKMRYIKKFK